MNLELIANLQPNFIIDIGANVGGWYREAKAVWPNAKFLLIEGNRECEPMLKETGEDYLIALLSDREKKVTFYTRKDAPTCTGASIYREQTEFYEGDKAIPQERLTFSLDDLLKFRGFGLGVPTSPLLLKIDVQGSELDILKGGKKTLALCRGVILEEQVAQEPYNLGAPNSQEVSQFMAQQGWPAKISIGEIVHPITRQLIQRDYFYEK